MSLPKITSFTSLLNLVFNHIKKMHRYINKCCILKITMCGASKKRVKLFSSFGPIALRQEGFLFECIKITYFATFLNLVFNHFNHSTFNQFSLEQFYNEPFCSKYIVNLYMMIILLINGPRNTYLLKSTNHCFVSYPSCAHFCNFFGF